MADRIPALILALSEKVHLTPLAWREYPDRIVIVFREGPKIVFHRSPGEEPRHSTQAVASSTSAVPLPAGGKSARPRRLTKG